jgi:hypothetical protein
MTHSLTAAVADGTVTESAAFCGLRPTDIAKLSRRHGNLSLLVRLRSRYADGRTLLPVSEFVLWTNGEMNIGDGWTPEHIRDVTAAAT